MKKVLVVYVGPESGLFLSDLKIDVVRGKAFEVSADWFEARAALEAGRWKLAEEKAKDK